MSNIELHDHVTINGDPNADEYIVFAKTVDISGYEAIVVRGWSSHAKCVSAHNLVPSDVTIIKRENEE